MRNKLLLAKMRLICIKINIAVTIVLGAFLLAIMLFPYKGSVIGASFIMMFFGWLLEKMSDKHGFEIENFKP